MVLSPDLVGESFHNPHRPSPGHRVWRDLPDGLGERWYEILTNEEAPLREVKRHRTDEPLNRF